jgi:hypothetical protein
MLTKVLTHVLADNIASALMQNHSAFVTNDGGDETALKSLVIDGIRNTKNIKIWIAVIEHDYGQSQYAGENENVVRSHVFDYVKGWWEKEIGEDLSMPEDRDEAIEAYFNEVDETCTIDFLELHLEANDVKN